ncbi:spore coat protein U domain-containing protein [Lysobacter sp. F6437]|uniref:spore coat protein U domain-containing protein n=1 Tax=Lysobacter sp. F6437 TaxID=3459296 RepID=UPI00403D98F1
MKRLACMVLVATALLFGSREAAAQTCTASAPDLYFGNLQSPANATVDVAAPMTVSCSGGSAGETLRVCVGIDPAGYFSGRAMYPGGTWIFSPIDYEIYADSGRTQIWDTNPQQEIMVALNGSGSGSATRMMYARMAAPGSPAPGRYSSGLTDDVFQGQIKKNDGAQCHSGANRGAFTGQPFDVSVYINGGCEITVDPLLDFQSVSGAITGPIKSSIELRADCSDQLPYTIALGDGLHASGAQRRMRSAGGNFVDYGLFQDDAGSQPWGDGTPEPVRQGTGSGGIQTLTIHGRVPGGQAVPSGTYKDTVTATIIY